MYLCVKEQRTLPLLQLCSWSLSSEMTEDLNFTAKSIFHTHLFFLNLVHNYLSVSFSAFLGKTSIILSPLNLLTFPLSSEIKSKKNMEKTRYIIRPQENMKVYGLSSFLFCFLQYWHFLLYIVLKTTFSWTQMFLSFACVSTRSSYLQCLVTSKSENEEYCN